jgi:hypothetical protein
VPFTYHLLYLPLSNHVLQNNQVLQQLTFAGKKTLPAALRKDMWRPLLTATFPSPSQGLSAFRKLRELRMLHEHNWTHSDPEARKMPPKKERGYIIMDQKANTIADLAWVLQEQEKLGAKKQQAQEKYQEDVRNEFLSMAKKAEEEGFLNWFAQSIQRHKNSIAYNQQLRTDEKDQAPSRKKLGDRMLDLKARELEYKKMLAADKVMKWAQARALKGSKAQEARGTTTPDSLELTVNPPKIFYRPSIVRGERKNLLLDVPLYTADVVIRWTNPLDAEYAAEWPAGVSHDSAGLSRHTAAPIDQAPVFHTQDLISRNTSRKYTARREAKASRDLAEVDSGADYVDTIEEPSRAANARV